MTTYDPEDQAERHRVGGLLQEPLQTEGWGVGAKIPQRRPSACAGKVTVPTPAQVATCGNARAKFQLPSGLR
jgi:hypothetical protein